MTVPSVALQLQLAGSTGAWTDVTADTLANPGVVVNYGINGNGPNDRVAATGTMNFSLNNSAYNSAGKNGYYTPGHANARAGFDLGIGARIALTYSGSTFYKFTGRIDTIAPIPGIYQSRITHCTAVDWMDEAARHKLNRIPTQFGQRADQLISTVIGNMTRTPAASTLAVAQLPYPYALDTAFDESTTALTELQRICQSDRGYLVIQGDQTQGGTLRFYDRRTRMEIASASTILQTTMTQMLTPRPRAQVFNRIKTTAHPRIVDTTLTTVLYRLTGTQSIAAGATAIFQGGYTDPSLRAKRVGAASMLTPVATTDYTFGTSASDTTLTANLTVTASFGANSLRLSVKNNGTQAGILTFLQARGAGIYDYSPITYDSIDAVSSGCYGQGYLGLDLPYESNGTVASAIGDYEVSTWKNPRYALAGVKFTGTGTACLLDAGLRREPGDVIGLTESQVGLSASEFFIQSVQMTVLGKNVAEFIWLLQKRFEFTDFWILDVDKLSETSADNMDGWSVLAL